ncbi:hypothetical protein JCM5353_004051 [Sporobolomyces roseus]
MSLPIPPGSNPLELLAQLKQDLQSALRYLIVWLAILLFDYCATLPQEIKYIWPSKWSPLKVLFLLLRYWTIIDQIVSTVLILGTVHIPSDVCAYMYKFETWGGLLVIFLSSLILSLRVVSICEKSYKVAAVLSVLLVIELAWMIGSQTQLVALKLPTFIADTIGWHGCLAVGDVGFRDSIASSFWAAPLLFDTVILGITLHKIITMQRHAGGKIPILQRVLKSNVLYFAALATTNLVSVALSAQSRASIKSFNSPASLALTGIMTCRLVLVLFEPSNPNSPHSNSNSSDSSKFPFSFKSRSTRQGSTSKGSPVRGNKLSGGVGATGERNGDVELERVQQNAGSRYAQPSSGFKGSSNTLKIDAPPPSPRTTAPLHFFSSHQESSTPHDSTREVLVSPKSSTVYPPSSSLHAPPYSHFSDTIESSRPSFGSDQRDFA